MCTSSNKSFELLLLPNGNYACLGVTWCHNNASGVNEKSLFSKERIRAALILTIRFVPCVLTFGVAVLTSTSLVRPLIHLEFPIRRNLTANLLCHHYDNQNRAPRSNLAFRKSSIKIGIGRLDRYRGSTQ